MKSPSQTRKYTTEEASESNLLFQNGHNRLQDGIKYVYENGVSCRGTTGISSVLKTCARILSFYVSTESNLVFIKCEACLIDDSSHFFAAALLTLHDNAVQR